MSRTVEVSTAAGSEASGYTDGKVSEAKFNRPWGVATSVDGTTYVTDSSDTIRAISPDGVVSTLAGGTRGFADEKGSEAQFNAPSGLACGASLIYIADSKNNRIRAVNLQGIASTIAGTGEQGSMDGKGKWWGGKGVAQFNAPRAVAVGPKETLYVADTFNHRIRVIKNGVVSTLAGSTQGLADGKGSEAKFCFPSGIAVADNGIIYVADTQNDRIRTITPEGFVTTLANESKDGLGCPLGLAFGNGLIYVAGTGNHRINILTADGVVTPWAGTGSEGFADGRATEAQFFEPTHLAVSRTTGVVFVADRFNNRIRAITTKDN
jgi:DNA-binding beta-propeller fold protein YncE